MKTKKKREENRHIGWQILRFLLLTGLGLIALYLCGAFTYLALLTWDGTRNMKAIQQVLDEQCPTLDLDARDDGYYWNDPYYEWGSLSDEIPKVTCNPDYSIYRDWSDVQWVCDCGGK